jgi:hypothetical protein
MLENLSSQQLNRAAQLKERIEALEGELQQLLGTPGSSPATGGRTTGRRGISAAGKARIAAAQRARWAKARGANGAKVSAPKGRRRMSAAGRAKLAKAARARWAKAKAAGKSSL